MRIGVYADVATEKDPGGVGYHVVELLRGLAQIDRRNEYLLYYRRDVLGPGDRSHPFPRSPNFRERPVRFPRAWPNDHPTLWWEHYLPRLIRRDRVDVFHGPTHFLPAIPSGRTVVTIHDLAFFKMEIYTPGITAALRHWTMRALERAGRVIAISENTRSDIEALGIDPAKIRLIYGGGHVVPEEQIDYGRRDELRRAFHLPDRYILF